MKKYEIGQKVKIKKDLELGKYYVIDGLQVNKKCFDVID